MPESTPSIGIVRSQSRVVCSGDGHAPSGKPSRDMRARFPSTGAIPAAKSSTSEDLSDALLPALAGGGSACDRRHGPRCRPRWSCQYSSLRRLQDGQSTPISSILLSVLRGRGRGADIERAEPADSLVLHRVHWGCGIDVLGGWRQATRGRGQQAGRLTAPTEPSRAAAAPDRTPLEREGDRLQCGCSLVFVRAQNDATGAWGRNEHCS